jgi:hypothetical protein
MTLNNKNASLELAFLFQILVVRRVTNPRVQYASI